MFKDKNLLIIGSYPSEDGSIITGTFVKEQVDRLKDYFNKIIIISPRPYFPKFLTKFDFIPQNFKDQTKFNDYKYDNVEVYFPRFFTAPFSFFRKRNGDFSYSAVLSCIKRNYLNFDLIHSHFTYPSGYIGVKLKEEYNKKLVITAHGFDIYDLPFRNNYWKEKIQTILGNSDKIITVSESNLRCIDELGIKDKTKVIPNGFDSNKFFKIDKNKVRKELNLSKNKKILLHVGNLKPVKNQINLIKAVNKLVKKRKDIILYLIGSGNDRKRIENKIDELNLNKYIKVLGSKPHKEIPKWMNAADLFVFPSYSEGFGVVNIEALACGTPVISTYNGGSEEIITSDDYGFLLEDPEDYVGLSKLIEKGLNKDWDYNKILDYSKKYQWNNVTNKIIKEYKEKIIKKNS